MSNTSTISLPAAAMKLGVSWQKAYTLLLTGRITGRNDRGRWKIDLHSVEAELARRSTEATDPAILSA